MPLYFHEAWFCTNTCTDTQKYKILIRRQSRITHKMLFNDKVWVWCIISATKIIELIFFSKTVSSEQYTYKLLHYFSFIQVMRENTSSSSNVVPLPIQEIIWWPPYVIFLGTETSGILRGLLLCIIWCHKTTLCSKSGSQCI